MNVKKILGPFGFYLIHMVALIRAINASESWSVTIYNSVVTADSLGEVLMQSSNLDYSYNSLTMACSRKINDTSTHLNWEFEGQIVQHLAGQRHMEFNALIIARWLTFPWDEFLDTTFAVGEGLSVATEVPEIEKRSHKEASAFLNYLLFELTFPLQFLSQCDFVARIHHRSGVFGLFDNVKGASNAVGLGLKYRF